MSEMTKKRFIGYEIGKFLFPSIWLLSVRTAILVLDGKRTAIPTRIREDQGMWICVLREIIKSQTKQN